MSATPATPAPQGVPVPVPQEAETAMPETVVSVTDFKAESRKWEARAKASEKLAEANAKRLQELEDRDKSEAQKL